jgi:Ca-activated chloride channel family protein
MIRNRLLAGLLAALLVAPLLAACSSSGSSGPTLNILAGSELKDLTGVVPDLEKNIGWSLHFEYMGTLDGAERIAAGDPADLAWFSSGKYLSLLQTTRSKIVAQDRTMLSPVVLGVKRSTASALGWVDNPNVTWSDIAAAAKSGRLHYAMTSPASSNSGFAALVGVATAFANTGGALTSDTIRVAPLKDFFSGQSLTAGSSGFLADAYVRDQDSLDGLINYESVLLSLNSGTQLRDKLVMVYPKDGIVTADYPLMLLNSGKRAVYDKLLAYVQTPAVQAKIMTTTRRRPANPSVKPDSGFTNQVLVELPFPASLDVINQLIFTYLDEIRAPAHVFYVLDISGSMQGPRLQSLQKALVSLTGADTSITGQFARFRKREELTLITFNDRVRDTREFTINDISPNSPDLNAVRNYVNSLQADNGAAIYDALVHAYDLAAVAQVMEPNRFISVVLMTDGENNSGRNADQFVSYYKGLSPRARQIRTYAVIFGEASPAALKRVADTTGGTTFDARSVSLTIVFKQIRGYA